MNHVMTYTRYRRIFSKRAIRDDARRGVDSFAHRALEAFGPARPFNPVGSYDDQRLAEAANTDAAVEERKVDLEEQQKRGTFLPHPVLLYVALLVAAGIEMFSCIAVLKGGGWDNPERTFFGLALAALLFFLIYALVKLSAPPRAESASSTEVTL